MRGDDVAGHEQEPLSQRISGAFQQFIKMLPVEPRHFHVANHQVESLLRRAAESFASVQQYVHLHALVFEHVGDQASHGRLVFHHKYAGAISVFASGLQSVLADGDLRGSAEQGFPGKWWTDGAVLRRFRSHRQFDLENGAPLGRAQNVHLPAVLTHDA